MDTLNFFSWIKLGNYSATVPTNALSFVVIPDPRREDGYLPVVVPVSALTNTNTGAASSGSDTEIGSLIGGGIVVAKWNENGVKKALIASLTNLSTALPYAIPAYNNTLIGPTAQSFSNGSTNTDAIIAQTGVPATTAYAAGLARLYLGGGFTDWYLPAVWELNMCYNSAAIVNKVLGDVNGFSLSNYSSSTEGGSFSAWLQGFLSGTQGFVNKATNAYVRAVRIHTL
jgi:trimeric autotransporter adhesin